MPRIESDTSELKASSRGWLPTAHTSSKATGAINWPSQKEESGITGVLTIKGEGNLIIESACML